MPDGLDMMSQGLQIGLGLFQAQRYIAKNAPDPIGTEFSVFLEELNLGLSVREALEKFQQQIPLPEMCMFSTAVLVQREIGGSLAEVLNNLAHLIRERLRVEREIRSLTAQNRLSAWIVCSLPPLLCAYQFFIDPALMHEVVRNPIGQLMLIAALVMEILGILIFRRLLRLHI
jgi:tight adherence protein B